MYEAIGEDVLVYKNKRNLTGDMYYHHHSVIATIFICKYLFKYCDMGTHIQFTN